MNQPFLLHIVERLEGFLGKLPMSIQKPVLHELTPLKELFLQQRPPRIVLVGSGKRSVHEIVGTLFAWTPPPETRDTLMEVFRWQRIEIGSHGTISLLDARAAEENAPGIVHEELQLQSADVFLYLDEGRGSPADLENLTRFINWNGASDLPAKVVGILLHEQTPASHGPHNGESVALRGSAARQELQRLLQNQTSVREHLLRVVEFSPAANQSAQSVTTADANQFMSLLAQELPNPARVEMVRISRDRAAQIAIAQMLVKSTSAICTAIGAQPIPLADLPILTTLQLVMVSGIMYIGGRERSLRAATEFIGALGVNVGAGMLLREGARAILKFFPGWGNVVCGVVAGAGTYAIGRAAIGYFLEGASLKDARQTYLASRKKRAQNRLPARARLQSSQGTAKTP